MPRRSTPADPFKAREHKLPSHASRMDSQTCQRPLAQGFVRTTRRILVGDLVKERASHAKAFVEVEAGSCGLLFFFRCSSAKAGHACAVLAASQVGPHHLQIFDVELRLSRLVARNDVLLRKSGPGQRAYIPRTAKLGRPRGMEAPRRERNSRSGHSSSFSRESLSRCKVTKTNVDPDALETAICAAQAQIEEAMLFRDA